MKEHLGELIKEVRVSKGISSEEIIANTGIYELPIMEKGEMVVPDYAIEKVSTFLDCDIWFTFMNEPYEEKLERKERKRKKSESGAKNANAKFSEIEVEMIREEYKENKSISKLAKKWGCTYPTLRDIVKGKRYI